MKTINIEKFEVKILKEAIKSPLIDNHAWCPGMDKTVYNRVETMINEIEKGGEETVLSYAQKLDDWPVGKTILMTKEEVLEQINVVTEQQRSDILVQQKRVRHFANLQLENTKCFDMVEANGVTSGQKLVPVQAVGCYIPGGRYSHISSASMSIVTAKAAGCKTVVACSPPVRGTTKIHPATLYAMFIGGADFIMVCGGAQAIASMAFGLFTGRPVDMIVGPGNSYVAEAKRFLYGKVGIDMFAGPTEVLILADSDADSHIVATDLVSQAEHGPTSPAWLITDCEKLANEVIKKVPELLETLPEDNAARVSWLDYGEVLLVKNRDQMRILSDRYAAEHLQILCGDLDWWLFSLRNYGSLFLGEETCVTYGDKISGPNHTLPTLRGSRYTAGLGVDKYVKKLTYQRMTREANRELGPIAARISRTEGMEGHARSGDERVKKYFPGEKFDLGN